MGPLLTELVCGTPGLIAPTVEVVTAVELVLDEETGGNDRPLIPYSEVFAGSPLAQGDGTEVTFTDPSPREHGRGVGGGLFSRRVTLDDRDDVLPL